MSFSDQNLDPTARRLVTIGNLSLVIGLLLILFIHPSAEMGRNWLHGVSGFLLGLSIAINLFAFRLARRCRAKQI